MTHICGLDHAEGDIEPQGMTNPQSKTSWKKSKTLTLMAAKLPPQMSVPRVTLIIPHVLRHAGSAVIYLDSALTGSSELF